MKERKRTKAQLVGELQELRTRIAGLETAESQRKRVEEALRESEQRFRSLCACAPIGIFLTDAQGRTVYANPKLQEIAGLSDEDSRDPNWTRIVHPEDRERLLAEASSKALRKEEFFHEFRIVTGEGDLKWLQVHTAPVLSADGRQVGRVGAIEDITERKRAGEQAKLREQQLIQGDKMVSLGILISGVAHEINNPNHLILSQAPILARAWDSVSPILEQYYAEHGDFDLGGLNYSDMRARVPAMFSSMVRGSERIKTIVAELRDYARERPAHMTESVYIPRIIASAHILLSDLIKRSTDRFSTEYTDDLPTIKGNYQGIEQVVINLVQNACQALSNREQAIRLTAYHDAQANTVVIEVEDEGVGMPPDVLERVTDPFFTTKREFGGMGLGLSISSRIIMEHGGALTFSSAPGRGTKATVTLPMPNPPKEEKE